MKDRRLCHPARINPHDPAGSHVGRAPCHPPRCTSNLPHADAHGRHEYVQLPFPAHHAAHAKVMPVPLVIQPVAAPDGAHHAHPGDRIYACIRAVLRLHADGCLQEYRRRCALCWHLARLPAPASLSIQHQNETIGCLDGESSRRSPNQAA